MSEAPEKTWHGLVTNLSRALLDPDYRREISEDLEGDITTLIMEEAADVLALQEALVAAALEKAAVRWIKPPKEEWAKLSPSTQQHLEMGGLIRDDMKPATKPTRKAFRP